MYNNIDDNKNKVPNRKEIIEKCKDKKIRNIKFQEFIETKVSDKMYHFIKDCGTFLQLISNTDLSVKRLIGSNSCKNRFCPLCSWRKSLKDALMIDIIMQHLKLEEDQEFYFLTLTAPNVTAEELESEITHYNKSFQRLMQLKEVKTLVNGYVRKLEVTYNANEYITKSMYNKKKTYYNYRNLKVGDREPNFNTYHPHFHVILAIDRNAIKKNGYKWITQEKWLDLWKRSTRNSSITQVDFQKIRTSSKGKEAFEVAKYSAKDSDYLHSKKVFDTFYNALKGKQLIVYSGLFKEGVQLYNDGELDCYKEKDQEEYIYMLLYDWVNKCKDYEEKKKRELTQEEYQKYNKQYIEEMDKD